LINNKKLILCNNKLINFFFIITLTCRLDKVANTRILRSLIKLMDYNYTTEYLPGVKKQITDTLSRNPMNAFDVNEVQNLNL